MSVRVNYKSLYTTYSIVARDQRTGHYGVAVQTHQMSVGRIVPWLVPGLGAVVTQSIVNVSYGPMALTMLRERVPAEGVVKALVSTDADAARRQFAIVDFKGQAAAFTGDLCIQQAGHYVGNGYSVQANMMTKPTVIDAMRSAYENTTGDLAQRMLAALQAAQAEGGDIRGMQSAALKVVPGSTDSYDWETIYDLRVDEHHDPLNELSRLSRLRRAQLIDEEGHQLLTDGKTQDALARWKEARQLAPELKEMAFWQAITLADQVPDAQTHSLAARIMQFALEDNHRRNYWLELIKRLADAQMLRNPKIAEDLLHAIETSI